MQSTIFYERSVQLLLELKIDEITTVLAPLLEGGGNHPIADARQRLPTLFFQSRAVIDSLSKDPDNQQLITKLGLADLFEPHVLTQMITHIMTLPDSTHIRSNLAAYQQFYRFYARLVMLGTLLAVDCYPQRRSDVLCAMGRCRAVW